MLDNELGELYAGVLVEHRRVVRGAFERYGGMEVDTQGDAFFVAFQSASDAVGAASEAQRELAGGRVRVRMGIHTGAPTVFAEGYVGLDVHRAARICAAAHGGQVLVSAETVTEAELSKDIELRDLSEHRLKDLVAAERLFQLVVPSLPREFPPPKTLERPTNLPAPTATLLGRGRELEELRDLLGEPTRRLVTLTRPGGSGKTRLALEFGRELLPSFRSGAFLVELAAIPDEADVAAAVARSLSVREEAGRPLLETMKAWLRDRELLMVLDNFEHVGGAAPLVGELLAAAPVLTVLATSRSSLRVEGEHVYEVPPLDIDDGVALFVERARAVTAGFALTDETTAAVEEICRRLDGLPLAIELAAARVRILPPSALLARLDRRLELLTDGRRGGPERQQTLRATIDWSYHLLDHAHRTLLAQVSVFRGGFTLEAAENVAGVPPTEILSGLAALVEGSLLRQDEMAGEPRFTQLETIREYGLERLAQETQDADIRRRHSSFFLDLAERAEPFIRGPQQEVWCARLERDRENLRAGLAWVDDTKEPEPALRFVATLAWFWIVRGDLREAQEWLDRVLERPDTREPSLAHAKALAAKALLAAFYWDIERAEAPAQEALELARILHAPWPQAVALNVLGTVARIRGDHALAQARYEEVVALDSMLEDRWPATLALFNLVIQAFQRGDDER
ncbi:MAG: adenylate/guanylate cyclase domain-containing protein, partial [Actinobacteria bacterium]|nr:adenylate/guanylate cyclase domain-containing protein [Actinomycetota bacterium]